MGHIRGESRQQLTLFAERLDEVVTPDNPVRVIDAFVGQLDLAQLGFKRALSAETGRPGYDPGDLLRLYIYGYLHGVCSSRRLEAESQRNVDVMWLLGRLEPDFRTIATFRKSNGEAIGRVTAALVQFCRETKVFGGAQVALDGSKVAGQNARHRTFTEGQLRKRLARTEARVAEYLSGLDEADRAEDTVAGEEGSTAEALAALKSQREQIQGWLKTLQERGEQQLSLTDEDARRMRSGQGDWVVGYNVQAVVDTEAHLVVHHGLAASGNDRQALESMAKGAQEALGGGPLAVLADGGYSNAEQVARCEEAGIEVTAPREHSVNRHGSYFDKREFSYEAASDSYTCPAGETLSFKGESAKGERSYRTGACARCTLRDQCTKGRYRTVTRQRNEAALEAMDARARATPEPMRRRKATVEHVFGTLKRLLGGRFLTRGRERVRTELDLAVLGYNLRRMMNLKGTNWMLEQLA